MFSNLLSYSLERVSAVEHYYLNEIVHIKDCIEKDSKKYKFSYEVSQLLQLILKGKLTETQLKYKEQLEKALGNYLELPEEQPELDKGSIAFRIKNENELREQGIETNIIKGEKIYRQYLEMPIIHGSSVLIMLITRFEEFISNYLECIYKAFPAKYIDSKPITFVEISPLKTMKGIRELIVQREVEKKMREEYSSWFKLMEEHGLCFSKVSEQMKSLKEIYARRNIWVHNSGIVNSSYLSLVPETKLSKGNRAKITREYIVNAVSTLKIIIYTIMMESIRLIPKDEKRQYAENIFHTSFESLYEGDYAVAEYSFSVLENHPQLSERTRLMSKVDKWIAIKQKNGIDTIRFEVENWDVSAYGKAFHLAKSMLLEEFEEATELLEFLYLNEELDAEAIRNWPLFKDFRKTHFYSDFKEKHKTDFELSALEIEEENSPAYPEQSKP